MRDQVVSFLEPFLISAWEMVGWSEEPKASFGHFQKIKIQNVGYRNEWSLRMQWQHRYKYFYRAIDSLPAFFLSNFSSLTKKICYIMWVSWEPSFPEFSSNWNWKFCLCSLDVMQLPWSHTIACNDARSDASWRTKNSIFFCVVFWLHHYVVFLLRRRPGNDHPDRSHNVLHGFSGFGDLLPDNPLQVCQCYFVVLPRFKIMYQLLS